MSSHALPTVLIVDDEAVNRGALAELLQGECRILLAKDGRSALEKVNEEINNISLILLDVSMPGMDGYEVLRRLREDQRRQRRIDVEENERDADGEPQALTPPPVG